MISDERDVTNNDKDTSRHVETKDHSDTSQSDEKIDDHPEDSVRIKKEILSEVEEEIKPGDFLNIGKQDGRKDDDTSDEIVIIKSKKASDIRLRKSIHIQNRKQEEKKKLQQLEDQRGKRLADKFVVTKASVTYRPPIGYYGSFGVHDKGVIRDSDSPDIIELDNADNDEVIVDDVSNRKKPLRKPKVGFINNEVIDEDDDAEKQKDETKQQDNPDGSKMFDEDLEIDQETINNNAKKAIDRMDADDLELDKMMDFSDGNSNEDRCDVNTDDRDVNRRDVKLSDESDVMGNDVTVTEKKTKPKACGHGFKINEAYLDKFREEREKEIPGGPCDYLYKSPMLDSNTSEYISDNASDPQESNYETAEGDAGLTLKPLEEGDADVTSKPLDTVLWFWQIASQSEPIDNKGHAQHKKMLEQMSVGSEKDKKLLSVLHSLTKSESSTECYSDMKDECDEMSESSDGGESVERRVENDEYKMYAGPNDVQPGVEIEISTEC